MTHDGQVAGLRNPKVMLTTALPVDREKGGQMTRPVLRNMRAIGIDTGGTFTDVVRVDQDGTVRVDKTASTPDDYARGVMDAIELASGPVGERQAELERISSVTLGTTIATNAFLTRTGAKVGLVTTAGHGDTLQIMRVFGRVAGLRPLQLQTYALTDKPPLIVPRNRICEVSERIDATGKIVVALNENETREALSRLTSLGVDIVVVAFLWSFLNNSHERRVCELASEWHPDLETVLSSEVSSRIGEYERTATAVVDAFVRPAVSKYLGRVRKGLDDRRVSCPFLIMHSTGGVGTQSYTEAHPVTTLFSGPAGGVIGAQRVGELLGHSNIICTDVGGTSFDVALIVDGRPLLRTTTTIDQQVLHLPSIDIVAIGAGGGSLVQVVDGSMKIGPESVGAYPGPACYDRGGSRATLTDANVVLGLINPDRFLSGRFRLKSDLAIKAMSEHVAIPLGLDPIKAAEAVFSIVNAKMADLIRTVTVERGLDPRDFVLYAYGGLGAIHGPFYGEDLQVKSVVVPLGKMSSVFSAFGIAMSDLVHVLELSIPMVDPFDAGRMNAVFEELERRARAQLLDDGIETKDQQLRRFVDMRYRGQLSELSVAIDEAAITSATAGKLGIAFERRYLQEFGSGSLLNGAATEITAFRIEAIGKRWQPQIADRDLKAFSGREPSLRIEQVNWPYAGRVDTSVFKGDELAAGAVVTGPALIDLGITSAAVPPGWRCAVDRWGNLEMEPVGAARELETRKREK